ncbi:curli assembly protein CsgE [Alcanivorax nanhaiticus]|uniref:Curli production assembly/transport component CsgE n=1 Tax=Alcanivorax nanhaiticus TaxID=1177154 RepID=A0A095SMS6_9GAMM|nr:CsgE family curli-type amyloid fiber assembly protein [Alcanivorax nanhaiticus]KGD65976.1 curli assembly protein CsgE [Alcanivorax nanhaiticus]
MDRRRHILRWAVLLASLWGGNLVLASDQEQELGVVVDQTVTPIGKRFYQQFAYQRHYLYPDTPFSVSIYEQPSARSGSIITIKGADTQITRFVLSFASNWEDARVQGLVQSVENQVRRLKLLNALVDNPDLAKDGY